MTSISLLIVPNNTKMPLKRRSSLFIAPRNTSDGGPPPPPPIERENSTNSTASAASSASTASNADPDTTMIPAANEENERKQRQRLQKRVSIGAPVAGTSAAAATTSSPAPDTPAGLGGVSGYSAAQLAAHYDECMKLSAENKISAKNAFQLKMIDYMAEMLKKKGGRGAGAAASRAGINPLDNFMASSCALDASTKIYAHRVDAVHSDTMKLASGVGSNKEEGAAGGAGEGGEENGDDDGASKKRIKRKKNRLTVEKNLANINISKFELEFDIDPLFKKVSQQFDSGAGGGQFLSTLQIKDDTCEMLLDSSARVGFAPMTEEELNLQEEFALPEDMPWPKDVDERHICPTFAPFRFLGWSLEKEEDDDKFNLSANSATNDFEGLENDEDAFDAEAPCDIDTQDDDGAGGFDGGFGVAGGEDVFDDERTNEEGNKAPFAFAVKPAVSAVDIMSHLAVIPSEYSYFDQRRLNTWAGPMHWKFKPARNSAKDNEGGTTEKKKRKDKEKMVFGELDDLDSLLGDMMEKSMKMPKKSIKLQSKTMENWSDERTMLPEDLHYSGKDFVRLESMADWNVVLRSGGGEKDTTAVSDNDVADYDFDNLNDSQNFCPDVPRPDEEEDLTGGGGGEFTGVFSQTVMAPPDGEEGGAMALVTAPNKVEKIQIGYAKTAKKVDMRKLKSVEWSILVEKAKETSVAENKENTVNVSGNSSGAAALLPGATRFSDVYTDLRRSAQIPSKMQEGLTVPLAFVALLHLCNEQTLHLETSKDFTDFMISKG